MTDPTAPAAGTSAGEAVAGAIGNFEAQVVKGAQQADAVEDKVEATAKKVSQIVDPAEAITVLKQKVGVLHTIVHSAEGMGAAALGDIEAVYAEIAHLLGIIRSKL